MYGVTRVWGEPGLPECGNGGLPPFRSGGNLSRKAGNLNAKGALRTHILIIVGMTGQLGSVGVGVAQNVGAEGLLRSGRDRFLWPGTGRFPSFGSGRIARETQK